jgi:hypothetical protein
MMTSGVRLAALSSVVLLQSIPAATAGAQERPLDDWSLEAGLNFGGATLILAGALGGAGVLPAPTAPAARVALERRLAGGLWLMALGSYGTSWSQLDSPALTASPSSTRIDDLTAGLGLRYAVDLAPPLTLSAYLVPGLRRTFLGGSDGTDSLTQIGAFVEVGAMAEHEMAEHLWLRVSAGLATLSWQRIRQVVQESAFRSEVSVVTVSNASLALQPTLELRYAF